MLTIQNSINNVLPELKMIFSRCRELCFREDQPCKIIKRVLPSVTGLPLIRQLLPALLILFVSQIAVLQSVICCLL